MRDFLSFNVMFVMHFGCTSFVQRQKFPGDTVSTLHTASCYKENISDTASTSGHATLLTSSSENLEYSFHVRMLTTAVCKPGLKLV